VKLRHLKVENFRGIKSLDWYLGGDFVCLLGPGDSCKSTVLDSIDLVLSRRWNPVFDDADFFDGDVATDIVIEATLGELPRRMLSDAQFGLRLRGIGGDPPEIHDEPRDGDEEVITIRLTVTSSLEPTWRVVTDRHPEGVHISVGERERMGVTRLGSVIDRDLSWKRGSVLARLTGDQDGHAGILADAGRHARSKIEPTSLPKMSKAAEEAGKLASKFGVAPKHGFGPAADPGGVTGAVGLSLHDGNVPARRAGFGTRRLLALAMQRAVAAEGGIVLIDEVEHGLEPYRLRRVLTELLSPSDGEPRTETILLTTHSPIALGQLRVSNLRIVRTQEGKTRIMEPPESLQGCVISHAEAFLSRKVVVCEGPTEMGFLTGLDQRWSETSDPFAAQGVALANGGGAPKVSDVALGFRGLGYPTAVLADSDVPLQHSIEALGQRSVRAFLWDGQASTEQRLFRDLPWQAVREVVSIALDEGYPVLQQVASELGCAPSDLNGGPADWPNSFNSDDLREALGKAAKSKNNAWFKNHRLGVRLGLVVADHLDAVCNTDLAIKLRSLREWITTDE